MHPLRETQVGVDVNAPHLKDNVFLPCTYGYATTIRRAQGSSLYHGALWFDHCYPPERGYAYVGASRFKSINFFHYGRIRRSDWLPVGGAPVGEHTQREDSSLSENDESDHGMADNRVCGDESEVEPETEDYAAEDCMGHRFVYDENAITRNVFD